jgi:hypothetical protein
VRRVDLVRGVGLVVVHGEAALLELLMRRAGELDVDHGVAAAVRDERRQALAVGE